MIYYATLGLLRFFELIPLPVAYALAHTTARLIYVLDRRHRRVGLVNLRIAFPGQRESWRASVLRRCYVNLSDLLVEVSRFPRLTAEQLRSRVSYSDGSLERYQEAKRRNAGLLFFTAHVSAWELLPFAHALFGYPLSFVVRPINNPALDTLLLRYRTMSGNRAIPKKNALRSLLGVLQQNGDVGILIDQSVFPSEGVFVPFFGKLACTTNGLAMIALRTGAPVLPGFLLPGRRRGHYAIHFGEEVVPCRDGSLEENIRATTEKFNRVLEEVIRRHPDCWFWLHKRWKERPPEDPEPVYS